MKQTHTHTNNTMHADKLNRFANELERMSDILDSLATNEEHTEYLTRSFDRDLINEETYTKAMATNERCAKNLERTYDQLRAFVLAA